MKFRVTFTEELIRKSMMCHGSDTREANKVTNNCLYAAAIWQLVPNVHVGVDTTEFTTVDQETITHIMNTPEQTAIIKEFDTLGATFSYREYADLDYRHYEKFVGMSTEVEIPDRVIEYWYEDVPNALLKECKNLEPITI